jgi:4-amino-4-deoxy-L-arabinose transferase-like glycosyltransferase
MRLSNRMDQIKSKLCWIPVVILVIFRLLLAVPAVYHPERFTGGIDGGQYMDLASALLEKGQFHDAAEPTMDILRTPGYPLFLALVKLIFSKFYWASVLQILLTLVNCIILYKIGMLLDLQGRVGYAAILVYLLSANAAFAAPLIMTETYTSFWLIFALWMMVKFWSTRKYTWLIICGFSLGVGALVRPSVFPLFALWTIAFAGLEFFRLRKELFSRMMLSVLVLALSGYSLVFLWQVRNYIAFKSFTLSPVGNSTMKYWVAGTAIAEIKGITREDAKYLINTAPNATIFIVDFIKQNPIPFLKIQARGILNSVIAIDYRYWAESVTGVMPPSSQIISGMSFNPILLINQIKAGNYWILLGLFVLVTDVLLYGSVILAGSRIFLHDRNKLVFGVVMLALLSIAYMIITPFGHGSARFRVPVEPFLALMAALVFYGKQQHRAK